MPSSCPSSAMTTCYRCPPRLRKWHAEAAAAPPRLRTKPGMEQKLRDTNGDAEAPSRRRATANRILTVLKAALNHAWREGKAPSDDTWGRVAPFREVDAGGSAISTGTNAAAWSTQAPSRCGRSCVPRF